MLSFTLQLCFIKSTHEMNCFSLSHKIPNIIQLLTYSFLTNLRFPLILFGWNSTSEFLSLIDAYCTENNKNTIIAGVKSQ